MKQIPYQFELVGRKIRDQSLHDLQQDPHLFRADHGVNQEIVNINQNAGRIQRRLDIAEGKGKPSRGLFHKITDHFQGMPADFRLADRNDIRVIAWPLFQV